MDMFQKKLLSLAVMAALSMAPGTGACADYADAVEAYGRGDFATAYRKYLALAEAGDVRAQGTVACMLQAGEGVSPDPARALPWYRKAAEKGLEPAQYSLGLAYEKGVGTGQDLAEALLWYGKAAGQGDAKAGERLEAVRAAQAAPAASVVAAAPATSAAQVEPVAPAASVNPRQENGGSVQEIDNTIPPTVKTSAGSVKTPAATGRETVSANPVSEPSAGYDMPELRFDNGMIAEKRRAAAAGDVDAQTYLGWCYSSGSGVPRDKSEAIIWYKKAAGGGKLSAQIALGWIYYSGQAGKRDLAEAARWYRMAAAQGDAKAAKMLKQILKHGATEQRREPKPGH